MDNQVKIEKAQAKVANELLKAYEVQEMKLREKLLPIFP